MPPEVIDHMRAVDAAQIAPSAEPLSGWYMDLDMPGHGDTMEGMIRMTWWRNGFDFLISSSRGSTLQIIITPVFAIGRRVLRHVLGQPLSPENAGTIQRRSANRMGCVPAIW
jgi:hypothetical protein